MIKVVYENLYEEFKNRIPECKEYCRKKEEENLIDGTDGIHVYFSLVVVPYIIKVVVSDNSSVTKRVFDFIEEMAKSNDIKIGEVLDFTILEQILDEDKSVFDRFKKLMLPETILHSEKIEEYFLQE